MLTSVQRWVLPAALCLAIASSSYGQGISAVADPAVQREQSRDLELMLGIGAAVVTVPTTMLLGQWLGTLSNNLVVASVPALGLVGLVPPIAVAFATWLVGPLRGEEGGNLWLSLAVTTAVHVGALVVAGLLGLNAREPVRVALFTAADAVMLPSVSIAMLQIDPDHRPKESVPFRLVSFSF